MRFLLTGAFNIKFTRVCKTKFDFLTNGIASREELIEFVLVFRTVSINNLEKGLKKRNKKEVKTWESKLLDFLFL